MVASLASGLSPLRATTAPDLSMMNLAPKLRAGA